MLQSALTGTETTSSTPIESTECLLDIDPIASKWQELASMDQYSPNFIPLLSSLITGAGHLSTTKLRNGSAKITLDALDKVNYLLVISRRR